MNEDLHPDETPPVAEQIVRDLGLAPGLTNTDAATKQLIDAIREQTDEVVERAKEEVARERAEAEKDRDP
jgi:hypothetical protein